MWTGRASGLPIGGVQSPDLPIHLTQPWKTCLDSLDPAVSPDLTGGCRASAFGLRPASLAASPMSVFRDFTPGDRLAAHCRTGVAGHSRSRNSGVISEGHSLGRGMADEEFSFLSHLPLTRKAVHYAERRHRGQRRVADGAPFILHLLEVASLLDRSRIPRRGRGRGGPARHARGHRRESQGRLLQPHRLPCHGLRTLPLRPMRLGRRYDRQSASCGPGPGPADWRIHWRIGDRNRLTKP